MTKFATAIKHQPEQAAVDAFLAGATPGATPPKPDPKAGLRQINVRVTPEHWLKLKMHCLREGISMQDWVISHIDQLDG